MAGKTVKGLLFNPQKFEQLTECWQIIVIEKNGETIKQQTERLSNKSLNLFFPLLHNSIKEALLKFTESQIKQYFQKLSGLLSEADKEKGLAERNLLKEWHQQLAFLTGANHKIPFYHYFQTSSKSARIEPINFSTDKPKLIFSIAKKNKQYQLLPSIQSDYSVFDLADCRKSAFLLSKNRTYYLLKWTDFQQISWLNTIENNNEYVSENNFQQQVLARFEKEYTINRNGYFEPILVNEKPQCRVLLSELNNAFLMLTPQFLYDGLLVEGSFTATTIIKKNGQLYHVNRHQEAENHFIQLITKLHPNFGKQYNGYYYLSFADAQKKHWFLHTYQQLLEQNIEVTGVDLLQHFRYSPHNISTTIHTSKTEDQWVCLQLAVAFGDEKLSLNQLQKALWNNQKAVVLKNGSLGILSEEWLQQYGLLIKHGAVKQNELWVAGWMAMHVHQLPVYNQANLQKQIPESWWQQWQLWQTTENANIPIPATVNATLRPYQQKGFEWMILLSQIQAGALLADDMGLGKTLQTICVIAYLYEKNPSGKFLIVTPASLSYNWQAEFQKFCPTIQTFIFHGINRSKEALTDAKNSVIITTYGTLRSEIELLQTIPFTAVVADESHYIKNPGSLASRAIVQLSATTRIALTGTPIMNNTFDLYAQLLFLLPGMFGSRDFFKKEYADPIDRERDEVKMNALKKVTAPFIFRRTKEQVATDLPQKTETVLWCTMSENQKAAYESVKERIKTSLFDSIKEKGMEASKMSILNGMLQLRQICNDTSLIKNNDFFCDESVKVKVLLTELQNIISNHKALVFSQFTQMLDILETHFQKEKITYLRLDGSTPIAERQQLVEQFQQEDGNERVFLISLKAGNAGLTLTAADYVFLFDPWWNTAVQQQAIDRTHRIGQTKNVFAYQLICKNTIEERIIQLQTAKKQIADELIAEEQSILKNLTQDDLAFLLS